MNNQLKGKYGEDLAVSYLEKQDYEIIERNYRHGRGEIDLIGIHKNQLLVFFEIKLRKNKRTTFAEKLRSERWRSMKLL